MDRPKLKLIRWEDAHNSDHDWRHRDEIPEHPVAFFCETVGFEVARDEKRVTLAMSFADNGNLCDLFTIPLSMISEERVLT